MTLKKTVAAATKKSVIEVAMKRLADQHAIEWISMVHREMKKLPQRHFFQREAADFMSLPTVTSVFISRRRQG